MKKILVFALFAFLISSASYSYAAEPLTVKNENGGFLAVGYIDQAIAVRVALSDLLALEGSFGFKSENDSNKNDSYNYDEYTAGGRALYVLTKYNDFNVYGFGGLFIGYINPADGDSSIGTSAKLGAGIEYFIVPNLSVSAEMGALISFHDDYSMTSTYSDWASVLGFRYYFY